MREVLLNLEPLPRPSSSRLFGLGFTGLINVAIIIALALGLRSQMQTAMPLLPIKIDLPKIDTQRPPPPKDPPIAEWGVPPIDSPTWDFQESNGGITVQTFNIVPPQPISSTHTRPDYPPQSRKLSEEGTVRLVISIDERGYVSEAQIISSSGFPRLDEAAATWVKAHWRYWPAVKDGKPVPAKATASVLFKLT